MISVWFIFTIMGALTDCRCRRHWSTRSASDTDAVGSAICACDMRAGLYSGLECAGQTMERPIWPANDIMPGYINVVCQTAARICSENSAWK